MGSCNLWLSLIALLSLIRIAPVYCQHTEDQRSTFLVAIKNNESGLEVRVLFPEGSHGSISIIGKSQRPNHELETQMRFIPGYSLSSECGDQYYRCQEQVLVVNNASQFVNHSVTVSRVSGRSFSLVFVPLETGVLLLSFWYDSNIMTEQWNVSVVNSSNCTPTVFYAIDGKLYMVCSSSYEEYINVAVYEILLKFHSIIEFEGAEQMAIKTNTSNSNSLSNFIIVDHRIYFAIGNIIYALDVFNSMQPQQYPELPECSQVYKLVPTVNTENQQVLIHVLAYCIDKYFCIDPEHASWTTFSSDGVPYFCPNTSYNATLVTSSNADTLKFSVRDSLTHTINNVSIGSGICFESHKKTYFAYSDQQSNNVSVYDFTTQYLVYASPYDCSTHIHQAEECPQLFILGNQYLLIRDSSHDIVLDTITNFSLIINISSAIADILAVLHTNIHSAITPSPPWPITPSTTAKSARSNMNIVSLASISTLIRTPNYTHPPIQASSIISTSTVHNSTSITATTASPDISGLPRGNLVGIVLTVVIGLFIIIIILVTVVIGPSIKWYWRNRRHCNCCNLHRISRPTRLRLRFSRAYRNAPIPLLALDSAREEEDIESLEMELKAKQLGWRITPL